MAVDNEVSKLAVQNMECRASNVCCAQKKTQNQSLLARKTPQETFRLASS